MKKLFVATLTLFCASVILFNLSISFAAGNGRPLRGDFTGDGRVTSDDAVYLLRYVLFPNDYPICDHAYGTYWVTVKEPTEALTGMKKQYCEECGAILGEEEIPCIEPSKLEYQINEDGKTCTITGPGDFEGDTLIIPDTINGYIVSRVGSWAFTDMTEIKSVIISDNVIEICERAFSGCSGIRSLALGAKTTTISSFSFYGCTALNSINIPNSVTYIGQCAFSCCTGVTKVYVGSNVEIMDNGAFSGCTSLNGVYVENVSTWCNIEFVGTSSNPTVYANNIYLHDHLIVDLVIPEDVTVISAHAFASCTCINNVVIPNSVVSIGDSAFGSCVNIKKVTIGNGVNIIGIGAFSGCQKLETVSLGNGLKVIGDYAFSSCAIRRLVIPQSVSTIGNSAFGSCSELTSITFGSGLKTIGNYAFRNCSNVNSINYTDTKSSWELIEKKKDWDSGLGTKRIKCIDGEA